MAVVHGSYEWVHRWFHERIYECVAVLMQCNTIIFLFNYLSTKNNTLCFAELNVVGSGMVWCGMVDVCDGYLAAEASGSSFG